MIGTSVMKDLKERLSREIQITWKIQIIWRRYFLQNFLPIIMWKLVNFNFLVNSRIREKSGKMVLMMCICHNTECILIWNCLKGGNRLSIDFHLTMGFKKQNMPKNNSRNIKKTASSQGPWSQFLKQNKPMHSVLSLVSKSRANSLLMVSLKFKV